MFLCSNKLITVLQRQLFYSPECFRTFTLVKFALMTPLFFQSFQIGRLHCLYPWWEDATVSFMVSGGYNVSTQIEQVCTNAFFILDNKL